MGQHAVSDKPQPQIVVYALADARAALEAAAELGVAVTLVSPAGAAAFAGPEWFRELAAQAGTAVPAARFDAVLDCGPEAGLALAAIRAGVAAIRFEGPEEAGGKIADIAAQAGCRLAEIDYAAALDLDRAADPKGACRAWLAAIMAQNGE